MPRRSLSTLSVLECCEIFLMKDPMVAVKRIKPRIVAILHIPSYPLLSIYNYRLVQKVPMVLSQYPGDNEDQYNDCPIRGHLIIV